MNVIVNGAPAEIEPGTTLAQLADSRGATRRGSAAAVDGQIVPRSTWADHVLAAGAQIELLTAVPGG